MGNYTLEGVYKYSLNDVVTIKIIKSSGMYDYIGVVLDGTSDWHRKQIGQTVIKLNKIGDNKYHGSYNAYHQHSTFDINVWLEIEKAEVEKYNGSLRFSLESINGGVFGPVYDRVK